MAHSSAYGTGFADDRRAVCQPRLGYGVGAAGNPLSVVRTTDGGRRWETIGRLPSGTIGYGAYDDLAVARREVLFYAAAGGLLESEDGGERWSRLRLGGHSYGITGIDFTGPQTGCAAVEGPSGFVDYATLNGGRSWQMSPNEGVAAPLCAMNLSDPGLARAAMQLIHRLAPTGPGATPPNGRYLVSAMGSGGGSLWIALSSSRSRLYVLSPTAKPCVHVWPDNRLNILGLSVVNAETAYVWTADGRLLATRDAGRKWTQIP